MDKKLIAKELVKIAKELQAAAFVDASEEACKQLIDGVDKQFAEFQHVIADVGENIQIKKFDIDNLIKQIDSQIYELIQIERLFNSGAAANDIKYLSQILQNKNAQKYWEDAKLLLKQKDGILSDISKKKKVLQQTWQYLTKAKQDIRQRIVTLRKM